VELSIRLYFEDSEEAGCEDLRKQRRDETPLS